VAADVRVDGVEEWAAAVDALLARVGAATDKAVDGGLALIARAAQQNLTIYTHPPRTVTPSPPGGPPALISGALRRSIKTRRTKRGPTQYEGRVGPTIVYARIQELGGVTGAGYRTRLPPRPYLRPASDNARPRVQSLFHDAWAQALRG
jgi:phage gpG-like protein